MIETLKSFEETVDFVIARQAAEAGEGARASTSAEGGGGAGRSGEDTAWVVTGSFDHSARLCGLLDHPAILNGAHRRARGHPQICWIAVLMRSIARVKT